MRQMQGVIAQLKTYGKKGEPIDSEIVFKPQCDWYMPDLQGYLAQTQYPDIAAVIDEFGLGVATKVITGEVVSVVRELQDDAPFKLSSCPVGDKQFQKISSPIRYPIDASKEQLISKRLFTILEPKP